MNKIQFGLALIGICAASTSSFSSEGTISFEGKLVSGTCSPSVGGGGASSTVTLPTLNTSSLLTANSTAGAKAFEIILEDGDDDPGCASDGKYATPYFEYDAAKVDANGRLINTATDGAENVVIQLLNNTNTPIDLVKDLNSQITSTASDNTTYKYTARYFATGPAGAGPVSGSISYSFIYK